MATKPTKSDNGLKSAIGSKPTKKRNPHTQDGRARRMVKFHLDISRDDDYELQKQIVQWKQGSQFLPMIRKAFWLLISLMTGSIELLAEYFPGIIEAIRIDAIADMEARNLALQSIIDQQEGHIAELERQLSTRQTAQPELSPLQAQLNRVEALLLAQGKPVIQDAPNTREMVHNEGKPVGLKALQPVAAAGSGQPGPKQLAGASKPLPGPVIDDESDEDLLIITKDLQAGKRATENFLRSLMDLTEETKEDKPKPDNKAYSGRQRARMNADKQT
jgi:hypothetical protein